MATDSPPPTPEQRMADYLLGGMSRQERRDFERWLTAHPQWQAAFAEFCEVLSELPDAFEAPAKLPPHLRANILQSSRQRPLPAGLGRTILAWQAAGGTALLLVALLGGHNYHLAKQLEQVQLEFKRSQQELALVRRPDSRVVALKPTGAGLKAVGFLLVNAASNAALLRLSGLPRAAAGKVYVLWAVVGREHFACGRFLSADDGDVFVLLPLDGYMGSAPLEISLEQENSSRFGGQALLAGRW
ncbi:MAG: anti-sigma factor [Aphanocapsa lilacina HA4352-LM1]|nr:anti-sigma factor [Aphanocapsa lilacina HA4352-LM1]